MGRLKVAIITMVFHCIVCFGMVSQETVIVEDSLEWKLAQLFVVKAENVSNTYVLPGFIINRRLPVEKNGTNNLRYLIDFREAGVDSLTIPSPPADLLNSINNSAIRTSFVDAALKYSVTNNANGVVISDEEKITTMYLYQDTLLNNSKFKLHTFPDDLLSILSSKHELNYEITGPKTIFPAPDFDFEHVLGIEKVELGVSFEELLKQDILFYSDDFELDHKQLVRAFKDKLIEESLLDEALERRNSKIGQLNRHHIKSTDKELISEQLILRYKVYQHSMSMYSKTNDLPGDKINAVDGVIRDYRSQKNDIFLNRAKFYKPKTRLVGDITSADSLLIMLCDSPDSLISITEEIRLNQVPKKCYKVLLVSAQSASFFNSSLMQMFDVVLIAEQGMYHTWDLMAQALYGGLSVNGVGLNGKELLEQGFKRHSTQKTRIGFSFPEYAGIPQDSISKINELIREAIKEKATPGAQLLIARSGSIVYQESYGFHTYSNKRNVENNHLYDVASLTKIAVTFPVVMQLVEQGKLNLDERLETYIPEIDTTDKKDISISELLLHESGLRSYIPFHRNAINKESLRDKPLFSRRYSSTYNIKLDNWLYQNRHARYRPDVFSRKPDSAHTVELSTNMYMSELYKDSMLAHIYASELRETKEYLYSDLGYHLLEKAIEPLMEHNLDHKFEANYSNRIGANSLVYNPLSSFDLNEIVPSEKDLGFRKELLHGYVHDQSAAMMGGVSAHAGLFANAGDLAKMSQLFLNKGKYGGVEYFNPATIEHFTKRQNNTNRRGLGVDKPEHDPDKSSPVSRLASPASYGHTGFTGTILWIDPQYDLIYIFLSNRIHPRAYNKKLIEMNVRTNIQDIIYNSIIPN
ncbi:serine hydrolase domain-containing protein [Carboxylicivirga sp. N1Y90]|uniref:serine hydrolase domain-containing protein n=1 Tax=Carboxylicivirga fragile TaxID=3417571 RepID=UPI003D34BEF6|nr:serine hydrolase [Marinilabiliaceae bacterium N1Y90]